MVSGSLFLYGLDAPNLLTQASHVIESGLRFERRRTSSVCRLADCPQCTPDWCGRAAGRPGACEFIFEPKREDRAEAEGSDDSRRPFGRTACQPVAAGSGGPAFCKPGDVSNRNPAGSSSTAQRRANFGGACPIARASSRQPGSPFSTRAEAADQYPDSSPGWTNAGTIR